MRAAISALCLVSILSAGCADADGDGQTASKTPYIAVDDRGTPLREDFNRGRGSVRLMFVVDPTCGECLRGMDDMNKDLLSKTDDPRLQTFVVHLPVIGATSADVVPSMKLLPNANVKHYWNASGAFGRELGKAVVLKEGDAIAYAWDVWLVYGPEAVWEGAGPPKPYRLMHQLRLPDTAEFPRLDSKVLAREVRQLLDGLPSAKSKP